jgi:hypothetical protein
MTPLGHLAFTTQTFSLAGLIKLKDFTKILIAYLLSMIVIYFWASWFKPTLWIMYFYDDITWVIFLVLVIYRYRDELGVRLLIAALVGSQVLSGFSHAFDRLSLILFGTVSTGMWEPHNFWHSPLFAIMPCLVFTPIVTRFLKIPNRGLVFLTLYLGYSLHVLADTITYDFPIYWAWPFSDFKWSIYQAFAPPIPAGSGLFGHPFINVGTSAYNAQWGWVMYAAEPAIIAILMVYCYLIYLIRYLLGKTSPSS